MRLPHAAKLWSERCDESRLRLPVLVGRQGTELPLAFCWTTRNDLREQGCGDASGGKVLSQCTLSAKATPFPCTSNTLSKIQKQKRTQEHTRTHTQIRYQLFGSLMGMIIRSDQP